MILGEESEYNHTSLCITCYNDNGTIHNFMRVAEEDLTEDGSKYLSWIDKPTTHEFPDGTPGTLYNPLLIESRNAASIKSDFLLLKWREGYDQHDKKIARVLNPYQHWYPTEPENVYEIFNLTGKTDSEGDVPRVLKSGFPCLGNTSKKILIAYKWEGENDVNAILVSSHEFVMVGGDLRLRPLETGSQQSYSARSYKINSNDIREVPSSRATRGPRYLCDKQSLTPLTQEITVRSFDEYAADYVKWFHKSAQLRLSNTEKSKITNLIEVALKTPEKIEAYKGASLNNEDRSVITAAVAALVSEQHDQMSTLVTQILKDDKNFHAQCLEELLAKDAPELSRQRNELESLQVKQQAHRAKIDTLLQKETEVRQRINSLNLSLENKKKELQHFDEEKEQLLSRLNDDVALRLGLRTIASTNAAFQATPKQTISPSLLIPQLKTTGEKDNVLQAFAKNLQLLGFDTSSNSIKNRQDFAQNLLASLRATHLLAIDSSSTFTVANALSVALTGQSARRISIPADWNKVEALTNPDSNSSPRVLVLDNVLDTVNEGLLFSLTRTMLSDIIILPIGSHGTLNLVAPEVWDQVFLVPTTGFLCFDSFHSATEKKLFHSTTPLNLSSPTVEFEDFAESSDLLEQLPPNSSQVLITTIIRALEDVDRDNLKEEWTLNHMLLKIFSSKAYGKATDYLKQLDPLLQDSGKAFLRSISKNS
jgi:hypothetical protein